MSQDIQSIEKRFQKAGDLWKKSFFHFARRIIIDNLKINQDDSFFRANTPQKLPYVSFTVCERHILTAFADWDRNKEDKEKIKTIQKTSNNPHRVDILLPIFMYDSMDKHPLLIYKVRNEGTIKRYFWARFLVDDLSKIEDNIINACISLCKQFMSDHNRKSKSKNPGIKKLKNNNPEIYNILFFEHNEDQTSSGRSIERMHPANPMLASTVTGSNDRDLLTTANHSDLITFKNSTRLFRRSEWNKKHVQQTKNNLAKEFFIEGQKYNVTLVRYERNRNARKQCLQEKGHFCTICDMSFNATYGDFCNNFIHVHHVQRIADRKEAGPVDPGQDLIPLCPNCHAVVHLRNPPYTPEEVKKMIYTQKKINQSKQI